MNPTCAFMLLAHIIAVAETIPVTSIRQYKREIGAASDPAKKYTTGLITIDKLSSDYPYETLLVVAPSSVNLLGQLVLISADKDFPLTIPSNQTASLLRHSTFRPTMIQVSNEGWDAFNLAHGNMNQIRLGMALIPGNVLSILEFLNNPSDPEVLKEFIQIPIDSIKESTADGRRLATETYEKFVGVQHLLQQTQEALAATQGKDQIAQEEIKTLIEANSRILARQKENLQQVDEELGKARKQSEDAQRAYEQAIKDIPSSWENLAMDLCRIPVNVVQMGTTVITNMLGGGDNSKDQQQQSKKPSPAHDYTLATTARQVSTGMKAIADTLRAIPKNESLTQVSDCLKTVKIGLDPMKARVASLSDSSLFVSVKDLVDKGQTLVDGMLAAQNQNSSVKQLKLKIADAEGLVDQADRIVTDSDIANTMDIGDISQNPGESSEVFKAKLRQKQIAASQKHEEKVFEIDQKRREQVGETEAKLATLNIQDINFAEILKVLATAIKTVSEITGQWEQLVQFFQVITNVADSVLKQKVEDFQKFTEKSVKFTGYKTLPSVVTNEMGKVAVDASTVAAYLESMAGTYVNISNLYLTTRLAKVSGLLSITDPQAREVERQSLRRDSIAATRSITEYFTTRRNQLKERVAAEAKEIREVAAKSHRPISTNRTLVIRSTHNWAAAKPLPHPVVFNLLS